MSLTPRHRMVIPVAAATLLLLPAASPPPSRPGTDHMQVLEHPGGAVDRALDRLVAELDRHLRGHHRVAVVDFANLGGQTTVLGQWVAEELLARLHGSQHYELVDRLYTRVAVEHAGVWADLTGPDSVQVLGKSLGAQALVTGTISDLGPVLRVYARVYDTATGTVSGMEVAQLPNTPILARLLRHLAPWQAITGPEASPDTGAGISWAVSAKASSQYSDPAWSAMKATGAPDTEACGDSESAWAALAADGGMEWLEVSFARSLIARSIYVRESFNPGEIVKIEALTERGAITVWQGTDPTRACPGTLVVHPDPAVVVNRLRITLDTKKVAGWSEIDAVGISGDVEETARIRR